MGYIDRTGKETIPLEYDGLYQEQNGALIAILDDNYGLIDTHNNIILPIEYDKISLQPQDRFSVKNGEKWFEVDDKGRNILESQR